MTSFGEFTRAVNGDKVGLRSLLADGKVHLNEITRIRGIPFCYLCFRGE